MATMQDDSILLSKSSQDSSSLTLSSPLTVNAMEISKDSFDITQLANLLHDQPVYSDGTDHSHIDSPLLLSPSLLTHTPPKVI